MPVAFNNVRKINLSGFTTDPDPNTTPPAPADILSLVGRVAGDVNVPTVGNMLYLLFQDGTGARVAAATADITPWFLDSNTGFWISTAPLTAVPCLQGQDVDSIGAAQMFIQITAKSISTATTLQIRISEKG